MKPPSEALLSIVRQWIAKADIDFRTAERLLCSEDPIRESGAFHCQQASEKYLKAFLVWQQIEFTKTHSIAQLLDLVASVAPDLAASLAGAVSLTPFGVRIRYPDDFPELPVGQEAVLFELAKMTRDRIMARLERYLSGK